MSEPDDKNKEQDFSAEVTDKREENPYFYKQNNEPQEEYREQDAFFWVVKSYVIWLLIIVIFTFLLEKVI
ncbi:MAG: hypothetical protein IJ566_04930 [Cardiobacteriaceae bacterium]|nr:hypothetical protein [Cardiobacteriaceae bacterium]